MFKPLPQLSLKSYQEDRFERGVYDRRNTLNDLTGKEWLFSTKTIIPKIYPNEWPTSVVEADNKPVPIGLSRELIETFTKPHEKILDPFAGIGSTIFSVKALNEEIDQSNRSVIGLEDDPKTERKFRKIVDRPGFRLSKNMLYSTSSLLTKIDNESIDFILTDLPLDDKFNVSSDNTTHQASLNSINQWIINIITSLERCIPKLKLNKYLALFLSNNQELNFVYASLIANRLQEDSLVLKAERFWFEPPENQSDPSLVHPARRIFVFRKESDLFPPKYLSSSLFKNYFPRGPTIILHKSYPPSFEHKLRRQHGGMKPPELIQYLIDRYSTNSNDLILDPFVGVGGSLLAATIANRKAIGIDINDQWKAVYHEVCDRMNLSKQIFIVGNSTHILDHHIDDGSVGMIMTDVPYWAMDKLAKTRGRFSKAGEESRGKLHTPLKQFNEAAILSLYDWQQLLREVFALCFKKLQPGKPLVVFIGNMYRTLNENYQGRTKKIGRFLLLSSVLADILLAIGYKFKEEIVWYAPDKALHVFGYPYSYIPSVVHQDILVFKKPG